MRLFYECGFAMRFAYMLFLIVTILVLADLLWKLVLGKRSIRRIIICGCVLILMLGIYATLLDDHIIPHNAVNWQTHGFPLPIALLWLITSIVFIGSVHIMILDRAGNKRMVTESSIKAALDEFPVGLCYFRKAMSQQTVDK